MRENLFFILLIPGEYLSSLSTGLLSRGIEPAFSSTFYF